MHRRLASIQVVVANQSAKDFYNNKPEVLNARFAALRRRPGVCIAPIFSAPIFFLVPLIAAAILLVSPSVGRAAGTVDDWTGGASGSWTAATTTWSAGVIPTSAYDAVFNASGTNFPTETVTFGGAGTADGLIFNNTGTTTLDSSSATTETLTLAGDGISVNSGAGNVTIGNAADALNLSLSAAQSWTNNSASTLTVVNGVTLTSAGTTALTLDSTSTGSINISGVVGNGAGTLGLSATGGTIVLSNTNTFTGGVSISGGAIVQYTADANLGGTTGAVTLNGGTLNETSLTASIVTTRSYSIGTNNGTFNIAGNSPWTGAKVQFGTTNQITGSGTITKTGGGDMYITASQNFTGAWNINGGFVEATNAGSLGSNGTGNTVTINSGGELTDNGAVIPNKLTLNAGSVLATDDDANLSSKFSGTIALGGAATMSPANFYSGNTVALVMTASGAVSGSGSLTETIVNDGFTPTGNGVHGTVILSNATSNYGGGTTITSGTLQVGASSVTTGSGATLAIMSGPTGNGPVTVNGGILDLSTFSLAVGGLAGTGTVASSSTTTAGSLTIVTSNTPQTFSGVIANDTSNYTVTFNTATAGTKTVSLTLGGNGTGAEIFSGVNTYTGTTSITGGTLDLTTTGVLGSGGGTAVTVSGGAFVDASTAATGGLTGTSSLTINNTGSATLASLNNYSGGTTLNAGTLAIGISSVTTGSGATLAISRTPTGTGLVTVNGGTLDLSTFNLALAGLAGSGGTIASSSTGTAGSLTILAGATTQTYSGTIADTTGAGSKTVSVALDGTGIQVFAGANTYSGGTTVNSGTLRGTEVAGTPFGIGNINLNGGTLSLVPVTAGAVAVSGVNALAGSQFVYGGGGTLSLSIGGGTSIAYTVGNASAASAILSRAGTGTLIIASLDSPSSLSGLGNGLTDQFLINSTTVGAIPTLSNGIANPSIVGQSADANKSGDFLTTYTSGSTTGFSIATYTDTNFASPSNTTVESVTAAQSSLASTSVFALNAGVNISLAPGATLSIGNYAATATATQSPQAGLILDGGATISGGTALAFGSAEGLIYTSLAGGSIATPITGSGGITTFGPGALTFAGVNTYTGATTLYSPTATISATGVLGAGGGTAVTVSGGAFIDNSTVPVTGGLTGASSLTISNGSATLASQNTYTGGTTLTAGTLAVGVSSMTTGSGANLAISSGATGTGLLTVNGGTVDLSTFNLAVAGLSGTGGTIASSSTGTAGSLTILTGATSQTYSGVIANTTGSGSKTVSVTVDGTGTQVFSGTNTYTGGLTVNGATVQYTTEANLGAGTIFLNNGGTINQTNTGAGFTAVRTYSIGAGGGTFNFAAPANSNGTGGKIQFSTGNQITGFGTLTKTGAADAYITAAQNFTGGVIINGGLIEDTNATALGAANNTVTINAGQLVDNSQTVTYALTLNGSSVLSADNNTAGFTSTFSGPIAVTGATTVIPAQFYQSSTGSKILISNTISGTGSITVTLTEPALFGGATGTGSATAGIVTLSGLNTFTGTTTVVSGTTSPTLDLSSIAALQGSTLTSGGTGLVFDSSVAADAFVLGGLSGTANLALQNNATTPAGIALTVGSALDNSSNTYSGILSAAGGSLIKAGNGTLTLTGANTYAGLTIINGGTLQVGNGTSGSLNYPTGTPLVFTGSGAINFDEAATSVQQMVSLTPAVGDDTVQSTFVGTSAMLTFSSLTARTVGATMNFVTSGGTNGSTNSINLTGVPTGFIDQGTFFVGGTSNATYAYMNAAGTFIRGMNYGVDANSTDTTTNVAVLPAGSYDEVSGSGAVTAQTTAAITTLQLTNANNFTLASGQTLTVSGILKSGGSAGGTIGGGLGIQPTAGGELVIRTDQATDTLAISTPILANGADVLTVSGAGTLTLNGANTYSGGTYLNAGTLFINDGGSPSASAIGTGTLFINGGAIDNSTAGPLTVSTNNAQTWNGSFAYGGTQSLNLGTGAVTIAGNGAVPTTIALTVGAASAGTTLTVGGKISPASSVSATDTLAINGPGNVALAGIIANGSGAGALLGLTMNGTGVLTLSGANTFTGPFVINSGTVDYTADNNLGANGAAITLNGGVLNQTSPAAGFASGHSYVIGPNGGTINLAGSVPWVGSKVQIGNANQITGTGALTKAGLGNLWITAAQDFNGPWYINGGFIETTASTGLGTGTVTINSGGELVASDGAVIANNLVLNNGSFLSVDNTGTGTYTGAVAVSGSVTIAPADFYGADAGRLMTVSGPISGSGSITETLTNGGYTATSPGTLTLSGANTYTGGTILNAGTLSVNGAGTLGATTGTLQVNNLNAAAGTAVTLNLSTTAATTTGSLSGTIATPASGTNAATINTGAGQTFTVNQTTIGSFAGVIAGSGNFTLGSLSTSSTPLTLAGANTYTGNTTVNAGTLIMTSPANALGNGNLTVASGAAFNYEPTAAGLLNIGSGTLTLASGSTIGAAVGGTASQSAITTTGNASVGTSLTVNIYGIPSATPASGNYLLVSAVNATGSGLGGASSYTFNVYNATNFTITDEVESATAIATDIVAAANLAANEYWLGGFAGGNNVWAISDGSANSNWVTDPNLLTATSLTPGPGTTINFSATGATNQSSMVLGANMSIQGIVVNDTNPIGLNNDGNTLTIGAGGIMVNSGAAAVTWSPNIVLSAPQTWTNNGGSTLTVGSSATSVNNGANLLTIAGSGATTIINFNGGTGGLSISNAGGNPTVTLGGSIALNGAQTWTNNSSSPLTVSGAIVNNGSLLTLAGTGKVALNGTISGTGALTASGSGVVTLSGTNTFSGGTTVMATSTVVAGNTSALGYGAATLSGGTLRVTAPVAVTYINNVVLTGGATSTIDVAANSANPTITMGTLSVGSGTGTQLNVTGSTVPANQEYGLTLGATTLSGNVIFNIADNTNGGGNALGTLTLGSVAGNAFGITTIGPGTLLLNSANLYTGATSVTAGTLTIGAAGSILSTAVSVSSGATMNVTLGGSIAATTNLTDNGAVNLNNPTSTIATLNGTNAAATLSLNSTALTITGGGAFAGVIADGASSGSLTVGGGTLTLTGANTYSGGTTVSSGTLRLGDGVANNGSVAGNILDNATLVFANATPQIYGGVISGSGSVTVNGLSTLTLTNSNAYVGNTNITTGTLTIGATGAIVGAGVTVSSGATLNVLAGGSIAAATNLTDNGAVSLYNPTTTIATLNGTNTSAALSLNGTALTITGGGAFAGVIADGTSSGSLVVGGGTLTLTGANTYGGGTTISSGTLQLGDGVANNGSVAGNILDDAALIFANATTPQTYGGVINGSGTVTINSLGTLMLTGSNSYLGNTNVTAGTLTIGATGAIVGTGVTVASGATLNVLAGGSIAAATNLSDNGAVSLYNPTTTIATLNGTNTSAALSLNGTALTITGGGVFPGVIADGTSSGSLAVGGGTLTLTNANTYSGGTTISSGTLQLGDGIANNGSVAGNILDNAALVFANATPQFYGSVISGSGSVTVNSLSTLTLTGSNSYLGNTNVTTGTLTVGATGAIVGAGVTLSSGATLNVLAGGSIAAATNLTDNGIVNLNNPMHAIASLNGSGALNLNSTALTVTGGGTFSGTIADGASPGSLVVGGGILSLSGNNSFSGGTQINGGTLRVTNAPATSATGSGAVSVGDGGTLAGAGTANTGFVSGGVTVSSGGTIAPSGGSGVSPGGSSVGTLTVGALTLSGGSMLNYQISNPTSLDSIAVAYSGTPTGTGTLTMPASGSATFNFYQAGSTTPYVFTSGNTVYQLVTFGSAIGGGPNISSLLLNPLDLPAGDQATFSTLGDSLDLTIGAGNSSAIWSSANDTNYGNSANWTPGTVPNGVGLTATFGAGAQSMVSINSSYTLGQLNFNNGGNSSAPTAYLLTGNGNLTLNNSGSGASVNVSSGSLAPELGANVTLTLADSSLTTTFNIASGSSLVVGGAIGQSSSGQSVVLSGGGTLELASPNTYTGSTTISSGTLQIDSGASIAHTSSVSIGAGGTLQLAGTTGALPSTVNIATHGTGSNGDGALVLTGAATETVGTISGDTHQISDGSQQVTVYSGNTTVGDGNNSASLTATQILQNTLTINAGSTVTIAPSGSGIPTDAVATARSMATSDSAADGNSSADPFTAIQAAIASDSISSAKGQQLENRIAAIERLAATDPGLDLSLLEDRVLAALPSSSVWSSSGTSPLLDSGLLAVDSNSTGSSSGSTLGGSTAFAPAADFGGSPAAVPEPSTLLLAALSSIGLLFALRRRTIYCEQ